jgi:putative ABC transport system permease protein
LITPQGVFDYRVVAIAGDFMNVKLTTGYVSQANLAADFGKTEDVFIQLNLLPGADPAAVEPAIKAIRRDYPQFSLISGQAYYAQINRLFQVMFSSMYFLFGILAVPALIAMLNTLAIGVLERTREIGMLRAVGSTQKQVRGMVLAEALLLAAVGTAFGLLAGLYLGKVMISAFASFGFPMEYSFPTGGLLAAIAIGLLFGALAAIIPARQAARLEIVQALRYE